jgi:phosphohistidine phosphatase SixA
MTDLFLLRHAHAGNPDRWTGDDDARPLSDKGRRQAARLGALLAATGDGPDRFITSPRVRAAETAAIVGQALGSPVDVENRLAGFLDLATVEAILRDAAPADRPCLVGHDPAFSELLAELVGVTHLPMRKGALARLEVDGTRLVPGSAILRWLLPPELVPGG